MKRTIFGTPDLFSRSPMLSLLPVLSKVEEIEGLSPFFFARFEKIQSLRKELAARGDAADALKNLTIELNMLRQVLDWLGVKPEATE